MTINHPLKPTLSWLAVHILMLVIFLFYIKLAGISNSNSKSIEAYIVKTTLVVTEIGIPEPEKQQLIDRRDTTGSRSVSQPGDFNMKGY